MRICSDFCLQCSSPSYLVKFFACLTFAQILQFQRGLPWLSYSTLHVVEVLHPQSPPSTVGENESTKTWSVWGGKVVHLSKEKDQKPVPQWAIIGFNLHRSIGKICKAHQSLSGRNDQIIDNIQRTVRDYSESGQIVKGP